jgi:hypothetical protein
MASLVMLWSVIRSLSRGAASVWLSHTFEVQNVVRNAARQEK